MSFEAETPAAEPTLGMLFFDITLIIESRGNTNGFVSQVDVGWQDGKNRDGNVAFARFQHDAARIIDAYQHIVVATASFEVAFDVLDMNAPIGRAYEAAIGNQFINFDLAI